MFHQDCVYAITAVNESKQYISGFYSQIKGPDTISPCNLMDTKMKKVIFDKFDIIGAMLNLPFNLNILRQSFDGS